MDQFRGLRSLLGRGIFISPTLKKFTEAAAREKFKNIYRYLIGVWKKAKHHYLFIWGYFYASQLIRSEMDINLLNPKCHPFPIWFSGQAKKFRRKIILFSYFWWRQLWKKRLGLLNLSRLAVFALIISLPLFNATLTSPSEESAPPPKPYISSVDKEKLIPQVKQEVTETDASLSWWLPSEKVDSSLPPPLISARSAVAIDVTNKKIVFEKNPHQRLPQASTTKITTALVALDRMGPDEMISVSPAISNIHPQSTVMGLSSGEKLTLRELLYGMMLPSGNDAAMAVAAGVGNGSVPRFVGWMNDKLGELGLTNSRYTDPHGIGGPSHYSTAYELAVLAKKAMENPVFREIASTGVKEIPASNDHKSYYLVNFLKPLLDSYSGFDGVKPGYTGAAGLCLVGSATRDGRTVITVVLNSTDHLLDTQLLLDYSFESLKSS
jgi:D-alanyl-D-alanine carboxypeptidase